LVLEPAELVDPGLQTRIEYDTDVLITSYEALRAGLRRLLLMSETVGEDEDDGSSLSVPDDDWQRRGVFAVDWHRVVTDEASKILHESTQLYRAVAAVRARHRLLLSATPMLNATHHEFNAIFKALDCDLRVADVEDEEAAAELLRPLIVNHGPFATATAIVRSVSFETERERHVYWAMADLLASTPGINALARMTTLQALCLSAVVLLPESMTRDLPEDRPVFSKMRALIRYVREDMVPVGERGLVFSRSKRALYELSHHLTRAGLAHALITGDVTRERDKAAIVSRFSEPGSPLLLLLCTYQKVSHGTDGLQYVANHVLLFDHTYVPGDEVQAFGRVDRRGQPRPTHLVKFVLEETTTESHMVAINTAKADRLARFLPDRRGDGEVEGL
jgi:SNF2 family DNA or RNA helicase